MTLYLRAIFITIVVTSTSFCGKKSRPDSQGNNTEVNGVTKITQLDLKNYIGIATQTERIPAKVSKIRNTLVFDKALLGIKKDGTTEALPLNLPPFPDGRDFAIQSAKDNSKFILFSVYPAGGYGASDPCLSFIIMKADGNVYCLSGENSPSLFRSWAQNEFPMDYDSGNKSFYPAIFPDKASFTTIDFTYGIPVVKRVATSKQAQYATINNIGDILYTSVPASKLYADPGDLSQITVDGEQSLGITGVQCLTTGTGATADRFFFRQGANFYEAKKVGNRYEKIGDGSTLPADFACSRGFWTGDNMWLTSGEPNGSTSTSNKLFRIKRISEGAFEITGYDLPIGQKAKNFIVVGDFGYVIHGSEDYGQTFTLSKVDFTTNQLIPLTPSGTFTATGADKMQMYGLKALADGSLHFFTRLEHRDALLNSAPSTTLQAYAKEHVIANPLTDKNLVVGNTKADQLGFAFYWGSITCPTNQVRKFNTCVYVTEPVKTVGGVTYTLTGGAVGSVNQCVAFTVTRSTPTTSNQIIFPSLKFGQGGLFTDGNCTSIVSMDTSIPNGANSMNFYFKNSSPGVTVISLTDLNNGDFGSKAITVAE
jgi:hypothetical protein